jgi:hypothetical protein
MAADESAMDINEVVELVLNGSSDEENDESSADDTESSSEAAFMEKLASFLDSLRGETALNMFFFRDSTLEMLTSVARIAWKKPQETACMEAFRLLSSSFSYLPIIRRESVHWLNAIYRRLGGRKRIRNPYYSEIRRDIPYGIFNIAVRVVRSVSMTEFSPPHCFYGKNKAAEVISFVTHESATKLFSLLSGYECKEVKRYFKRTLGGRRKGNKVKLLVNDCKDMGFMYNFRKEQLTISFNYGEWNTHGFPQHS